MDYNEIFEIYEEKIPQIEEVVRAEEKAREIYERVCTYDNDLAFCMDEVIGMIARAYEAQGFNGGLAARGLL